jgi:soluble lytic murein transglycosylase
MMPRVLIGTLAIAVLSTLSCGIHSMAPRELPLASTSPPAETVPHQSELPLAAPSRPAQTASDQEQSEDAEITNIRAFLKTRHTGLARFEIDELAQTIFAEAQRNSLDPALVMALIHVESRFNNFAVSPMGALGLMQILPSTGEEIAAELGIAWHGPQTLFNPIVNVRLGVAYLRQLSKRYGDLPTALAAYNWGPGRIDRRIQSGTMLPTTYPRLVLEAHAAAQGRDRRS